MAKPEVRMRSIPYEVRFPRERPYRTSITIFDNKAIIEEKQKASLPNDILPTLTFLGYGHGKWATRKTIDWLGRDEMHYAAGVIMPFSQIPASTHLMDMTCRQTPHKVADFFREEARVMPDKPIDYLGHSQGGGIWGLARKERPEGLGNAALVIPLGFRTAGALEQPFATLRRDLLQRFAENTRIQNNRDLSVHVSNAQIVGQLVFDIATRRINPKLAYAFSQLIQEEVIDHVAKGHNVAIIAGEKDRVFPYKEIEEALSSARGYTEYKPTFLEVPGTSHESTVTKRGKVLLKVGVDTLKSFSHSKSI